MRRRGGSNGGPKKLVLKNFKGIQSLAHLFLQQSWRCAISTHCPSTSFLGALSLSHPRWFSCVCAACLISYICRPSLPHAPMHHLDCLISSTTIFFSAPSTLAPTFESEKWKLLSAAVHAIHAQQPVASTLEALYRAVESMCNQKQGNLL